MDKSTPLVFFGTEDFSATSLQALLDAGWPVLAVITKSDTKSGRGQKTIPPKVKAIAQQNGIKLLQPDKLVGMEDEVKQIGAPLGVLVAYGKIIPQSVIDVFPGGIINVHPSALPKYRGPAPVEAAILNGEKQTAVSLMRLSAGMDQGPVYFQQEVVLSGEEDRLSLSKKLSELGAELLVKKLPGIIDGSLQPLPQNEQAATYTKLIDKEDGRLDFDEPAEVIERKVRAYLGFPKSRAKLFGKYEVIITKARVAENKSDGTLVVSCNPGYLEIMELTAPSGRSISGKDFVLGYKN